MPNWCSNLMEVEGPDESRQALLDFLSPDPNSDSFDFEKVIPLPPALLEPYSGDSDIKHALNEMVCGWPSSYDFCCSQWGTKWNAGSVCVNRTSCSFYFSTAWCPPAGIYRRLSEMFPDLIFIASAFEGGCGICEMIKYENGSVIDEYYPEFYSKEWCELMFEVEGGEDLYEYDEKLGTYRSLED